MAEPGKLTAEEYVQAADKLLERLEADSDLSERELGKVRDEIVEDVRGVLAGGVGSLQTARLGRNVVVTPTSENFRKLNLVTERTRERFSRFKLQWLNKRQLREKITRGFDKAQQVDFFRHSNRLARNARSFLRELGELEPSLNEEIEETIRQIDDASNDLLKLEVRSFTSVNETLRRAIANRTTKEGAGRMAESWDLNRRLWNLSLVEHPKAVVRGLLANAAERMGERTSVSREERAAKSFVFVGAGPNAVTKMTPDSRAAGVIWRMFSVGELSERFTEMNVDRQGPGSSWRDLGLSYGTPDWYVPVPPEAAPEVRKVLADRRAALLDRLKKRPRPE